MASPPGTYQTSIGVPNGGSITVTINFDPTTGAIRNVSGAALVADNSTGRVCPLNVAGPNGTITVNVPDGRTTRNAQQLNAVGIDNRTDISQFQLAVPPA